MKNAFVLVAMLLAVLPSLAGNERLWLWITGYRIGDGKITANDDHRIVATNSYEVKYDWITVVDDNAYFNVSVPAGQEIKQWLAYDGDPTDSVRPPTETNRLAGAVTEYEWSYDPSDTADKYIVVDFDYITYTLKYNSGSGSTSSESHIYTNNFNLASNQFSKKGYSFNGWTNETGTVFADESSVSGASFGVTYTNATTKTANLYAQWTPNSYTVTLDPCEGSVDPESVDVTYDAAWPALPTPTRDGHRFVGWFTAASGGTEINTNSTYATAANSTNYAHWVELVTATFKDGNTGETLKTETLDKGGTPTPPEAPEHDGYYPKGWTPAVSSISVNTTFTMEYAQYSYTVVFHADNGTGAEQSQQFTYNAPEEPLNSVASMGFLITGYNFQNWTNSAGTVYGDGQKVSNLAQSGEYHLYATWTPITYTISFDGNGADSGSVGDIAATYDVEYPLPDNGFSKAGRSFKAWRLGLDGDTYGVGDSVSNLTTIADATVTFYAVWSEPRYIAFDGNGADDASAMMDDVMAFEGVETKTLISNKFEKAGYTFAGWATNETTAAALDVIYTNCAEVVSTNLWMAIGETNVLYAIWQTNSYTVVFSRNGGTGLMDNQVFNYDQAQALKKCGFSSNLKFQGWATSQTGDKVFGDEATVSNLTAEANGIVTLYAVWDNGDLSKAMHCNNLFWTQDDTSAGTADWNACRGAEEGYNPSNSSPSGSSVCAIVPDDQEKSYVMMPSGASGAGKLSFWYKMSSSNGDECWLSVSTSGNDWLTVQPQTQWTQYAVDIEHIENVKLVFAISEISLSEASYTVWIDQMTWMPDGEEPTEDDKPTINGFTATAEGFTLSVDDSNISDSFTYQILATNELVNGDWPVKTNLTADAIKSGYDIVPEANEPKMFYKVKVISK